MALKADSLNVMEYLWGRLTKSPDPEHVTFTSADLDALWWNGFVDTSTHSLERWRAAFADHRQPDGAFLLTKTDFFAKDRFRYCGEIRVPFDALKINEGQYTDEGFQELLDHSVRPSVWLPPDQFAAFVSDLKETARQSNELLRIDMGIKRRIHALIDQHPSPLRQLEWIFDSMIQQQIMQTAATTGRGPAAVTSAQVAEVEASAFTLLPDNPAAKGHAALKAIQKAQSPTRTADPTQPTTPLKQIRRARKGTRA